MKYALVTGAAAGIGKAIAKKLLAEGWFVGLADINQEALNRFADDYTNDACRVLALDVTSDEQWQRALKDLTEPAGGVLDLLVNNAGILYSGEFHNIPLDDQQRTIDINVKGLMAGCYTAFPYLKHSESPCIINMCSASAIYGQPSLASYSASKFAVKGLTEALNLEWEQYGIRVMDIMPLFVQTDMVADMDAQAIKTLGINLTAEDVASAIYQAVKGSRNKVHWPVGLNTKVVYFLASYSPDWLNRWVNKLIALKTSL